MIDPRTRLLLVSCVGVLAITLDRPGTLALLAAACAFPLLFLSIPGRWWARGGLAVAAVVWSTVLSQALFYSEHPRVAWVELGPLVLWREGAMHGLAQSLRFVATTLAGVGMAASTPPDRMLAALRALRVPFGLALMVAAALRFVPLLGREVVLVRAARAHRGRPVWARAPWAWLVLEVSLLRPVVARAWRRAHLLAESLDARGFDPDAPRAVRRPLRLGVLDAVVGVGAVGVTVAAVAARVTFLLYTSDALYVPGLRGLYGFVRAWL